MWLDELQRFLPGPYFTTDPATGHVPLTATAVRQLLDSDTPVQGQVEELETGSGGGDGRCGRRSASPAVP